MDVDIAGSVLDLINPVFAFAFVLAVFLILPSSIFDAPSPPPPPPGTPGPHIRIIKYGTFLLKSSILASSTKTLYSNKSSSSFSGLVLVVALNLGSVVGVGLAMVLPLDMAFPLAWMLTLVWMAALEMASALRLGLGLASLSSSS